MKGSSQADADRQEKERVSLFMSMVRAFIVYGG